jgi:hypothetical protein
MNLNQSGTVAWRLVFVAFAVVASLPRPRRRATSLAVGLFSLLVLVDAAAHPRQVDGLWTLSAASHITGWFDG